jgi:integrase
VLSHFKFNLIRCHACSSSSIHSRLKRRRSVHFSLPLNSEERIRGSPHILSTIAALPYAELPAFLANLRIREAVAARALEFLILTAARTGEVIGAQWSEIVLIDKIWTVPADRMSPQNTIRISLSKRMPKLSSLSLFFFEKRRRLMQQ